MKIVKQSIGIDISKLTFTACLCQRSETGELTYSAVSTFNNELKGFNQLLRWVRGSISANIQLVFLMEATGVYYENLAHHLYRLKKVVHVVLPNTSKHYFSSLNIKSKTDDIDAKILSRFGVERTHKIWLPPCPELLQIRNLTRYYVQLQEQKTALTNIRQSKQSAHGVQQFILKSNKKLIQQIEIQIKECIRAIEQLISSSEQLKEKVKKLNTIKGVALITIATVIAETMGFEHFNSARQLVSYAGYDVVQTESGTSVKGRTRISKKGNRYIRNALYFPGMVAARCHPELKEVYLRINSKKPSKMIGQVAIQRKFLTLMYTLWKNDTEFIEGYKVSSPDRKIGTALDNPITELL